MEYIVCSEFPIFANNVIPKKKEYIVEKSHSETRWLFIFRNLINQPKFL